MQPLFRFAYISTNSSLLVRPVEVFYEAIFRRKVRSNFSETKELCFSLFFGCLKLDILLLSKDIIEGTNGKHFGQSS
jgi:hypothetical protein